MLSYCIALSNELLPKQIVLEICENKFRGVPLKRKINQWSNRFVIIYTSSVYPVPVDEILPIYMVHI